MISKSFQQLKYDVRMKDWYDLQREPVEKELNEHLQKLPDLSGQSEKIRFDSERRNSKADSN